MIIFRCALDFAGGILCLRYAVIARSWPRVRGAIQ